MSKVELIHGDCFEELKKIPEASIPLIVTDPPYELATGGNGGTINKKMKLSESLEDLKKVNDITNGYDIETFAGIVEYLQGRNINAYFWCNKLQIPDYLRVYVGEMKCKFDILTWYKTNALPTYSNKYLSQAEYCLYFHKGKGQCHPKNYQEAYTYWIDPINLKEKRIYGHPTIKPLHMIERLIKNSSNEGDLVLDPFMGSGTTGIAALRNNRGFIGIELSDTYYNIAHNRVKALMQEQSLF